MTIKIDFKIAVSHADLPMGVGPKSNAYRHAWALAVLLGVSRFPFWDGAQGGYVLYDANDNQIGIVKP